MVRNLAVLLLVAPVLVPGAVRPLPAQARTPRVVVPTPLMAIARRDLSFGTVLAGIPAVVNVHDPLRSGRFEVQGPADASVRVEFILPPVLETMTGNRLPVRFESTDGFVSFSAGGPAGSYFNPLAPLVTTLGPGGQVFLSLGGTARAEIGQPGGTYRATIHLTVYNLGS